MIVPLKQQVTFAAAAAANSNMVYMSEDSDDETVVHKKPQLHAYQCQKKSPNQVLNSQSSSRRILETVDISELNNSNVFDEKILMHSTVMAKQKSEALSVIGLIEKSKKVKCSKRRK